VVLTGESDSADVRATDVVLDDRGRASYGLHLSRKAAGSVRLAVAGRHQVANTLAAAAVALSAGMGPDELTAALGEIGIVSSRRMDVFVRPDGVTVIDDTYNANPSSTAAALRALAAMAGKRRVAVLGYMAELGDHERAGHEEVGRLAAELGVDRLVAVAESARPVLDGAARVAGWTGEALFAADQAAAIDIMRHDLQAGDVVLVKGSRYRTWDVADALRPGEVRP
jgi:UDP-N-acetylmuramoyl-tripeptide--D-alanyl-D-alanine ligase